MHQLQPRSGLRAHVSLSGLGRRLDAAHFPQPGSARAEPWPPRAGVCRRQALFPVLLATLAPSVRRSIGIAAANREASFVDVGVGQTATVDSSHPGSSDGAGFGWGDLRVFTTFPLGLFQAWSNLELDLHCLVYPRPEPGQIPLPAPRRGCHRAGERSAGRTTSPVCGRTSMATRCVTSPGRRLRAPAADDETVHWTCGRRAVAGLGRPAGRLRPRSEAVAAHALGAGSERAAGMPMGLRLPSMVIAAGSGPAHQERCLTALALFQRMTARVAVVPLRSSEVYSTARGTHCRPRTARDAHPRVGARRRWRPCSSGEDGWPGAARALPGKWLLIPLTVLGTRRRRA